MIYTVQFQTLPTEPRDEVTVVDAECIPRVGDSIELDGECLTVLIVFHEVEKQGGVFRAHYPTVRVR